MKDKGSEDSSEGSDFVGQNYLQKQFQISIRLARVLNRQERNRGKPEFLQLILEKDPEIS